MRVDMEALALALRQSGWTPPAKDRPPCDETCPKCGSPRLEQFFMAKGNSRSLDSWDAGKRGMCESKCIRTDYDNCFFSLVDSIWNRCESCHWRWAVPALGGGDPVDVPEVRGDVLDALRVDPKLAARLIRAAERATPALWGMKYLLNQMGDEGAELAEALDRCRILTHRLRDKAKAAQGGG